MDNEESKNLKEYTKNEKRSKQKLLETQNHQINEAEREIQTFKHHFVAIIFSTNKYFTIIIWYTLIDQAMDTLNMLRKLCENNKLSLYKQLTVVYTPIYTTKKLTPSNKDTWYMGI